MSGFKNVKTRLEIHLAPQFTNNINQGIKDYLNSLLTKYIPELEGVALTYSNIKQLATKSIIRSESPYMHFKIQVDFLVFSPKVSEKLIGVVNKVSPGHIGCLVYGLFNASIATDQFGKKFTWNHETNQWDGDGISH